MFSNSLWFSYSSFRWHWPDRVLSSLPPPPLPLSLYALIVTNFEKLTDFELWFSMTNKLMDYPSIRFDFLSGRENNAISFWRSLNTLTPRHALIRLRYICVAKRFFFFLSRLVKLIFKNNIYIFIYCRNLIFSRSL